jgi:outer membrane lipoprotein carrier protein
MLKYIILILALFVCCQTGYPQSEGNNVLDSLQSEFNSINNMTANFAQYIKGRENLSGKLYYEKGSKLRLELKTNLIVTDGKTSWNYNKNQNKVIISNYNPNDPSVLSIDKIINDYPAKCVVSIDSSNKDAVVLSPKNFGMNFTKVTFWADSDHLIKKMIIEESPGNDIELLFSDYKLNQKIPASKFTFTPPKGCTVVDLR